MSESTFPQVHSLQFLFRSTHHTWRYGRKYEWVFISEHSVAITMIKSSVSNCLVLFPILSRTLSIYTVTGKNAPP